MSEFEENINRLTCKFNDEKLEAKYKNVKWGKNNNYIWNLMLLGHLIFLLVIRDDINQLGLHPNTRCLYTYSLRITFIT